MEHCAVYAPVFLDKQAEAGDVQRQKVVAARTRGDMEGKDRLARFGFTYRVDALAVRDVRVEVRKGWVAMSVAEPLVADMLALATCLMARLYGS